MSVGTRTIVLVAAMLSVSSGLLAETDPLIGTWKLNISKSKFGGRPSPGELTRKFAPLPNGIKIIRELVDANGKPTVGEWALQFDGKDYPVKGDRRVDTLSLKRLDLYTVEVIAKKDGKVSNTMRWDISKDGKTYTWTSKRVSPPEEAGTTVRVYDKQ